MIIAREDIQERIEEAIGEKLDPSTGFHCGISGIAGTVSGKRYFIKCGAPSKAFTAEERGLRELSAAGEIKTVIPGTVIQLNVKVGDKVALGDKICLYEAMKMQNIISAPHAGTVRAINVKEGDKLPKGFIMMLIDEEK